GASVTVAGFALTLVFIGGAFGKLACGWIADRFGIIATICITKALTAAGMLGVLVLPLPAALVLLPLFGIMLNGTSSATFGAVPGLQVVLHRHAGARRARSHNCRIFRRHGGRARHGRHDCRARAADPAAILDPAAGAEHV